MYQNLKEISNQGKFCNISEILAEKKDMSIRNWFKDDIKIFMSLGGALGTTGYPLPEDDVT